MPFTKIVCVALCCVVHVSLLTSCSALCTPVRKAAKKAYFGQIGFMRRGLPGTTARNMFADYLTQLAAGQLAIEAEWKSGNSYELSAGPIRLQAMQSTFGDVCLSDEFYRLLQNEEGVLRKVMILEKEVAQNQSAIPLLRSSALDTSKEASNLGLMEWNETEKHLNQPVPAIIRMDKLIFPVDGAVREDPARTEACREFQKGRGLVQHSTMSSDDLAAAVLAMVVNLIRMGANSTQSMQLLKHNTAFINLGVRCLAVDSKELQIPTLFLDEYSRQAGVLAKNLKLPYTALTLDKAKQGAPQMVELLSSFSSGGVLPEKIISTSGAVESMHFDWQSSDDISSAFHEAAAFNDPVHKIQTAIDFETPRDVISELIRNVLDRSKTLSDNIVGQIRGETGKDLSSVTNAQKRRKQFIRGLTMHQLSSPYFRTSIPRRGNLGLVRSFWCGYGWQYISRTDVSHWHEQCGASICYIASVGLRLADAANFRESCCAACNEHVCMSGSQAAAEGAAQTLRIMLPPYVGGVPIFVPIMI